MLVAGRPSFQNLQGKRQMLIVIIALAEISLSRVGILGSSASSSLNDPWKKDQWSLVSKWLLRSKPQPPENGSP